MYSNSFKQECTLPRGYYAGEKLSFWAFQGKKNLYKRFKISKNKIADKIESDFKRCSFKK